MSNNLPWSLDGSALIGSWTRNLLIDTIYGSCCDDDTGVQAIELVSGVPEWTDQLVELQLWVRLSQSALTAGDHTNVTRCTDQALQLTCPDDQKHRSVSPVLSTACKTSWRVSEWIAFTEFFVIFYVQYISWYLVEINQWISVSRWSYNRIKFLKSEEEEDSAKTAMSVMWELIPYIGVLCWRGLNPIN